MSETATGLNFLGVGVSSSYEHFRKGNYLSALGFFIDNFVAFLPRKTKFLAHGLASGIYSLANSFNTAISKNRFESFGEHLAASSRACGKIIREFKDSPWKALSNERTGCLNFLASLVILAGVGLWQLTGSRLAGATLRNSGEALLILNQINPQNRKVKPLFYRSGMRGVTGTLIDYCAKVFEHIAPGLTEVLYPLSMGFGAISFRDYVDYQRSKEVINQAT